MGNTKLPDVFVFLRVVDIANDFPNEILKTTGKDIDCIMPPVSRFGGGGRNAI